MAKIVPAFSSVMALLVSVIVNIFFLYNHFAHQDLDLSGTKSGEAIANISYCNLCDGGKDSDLSWTKTAAIEAEAVVAISCSGHGRAYVDGVPFQGEPRCECNMCYGGKDCSQFISECRLIVDGGDLLFLEPFWMRHAASSAVVIAGWHRMSYSPAITEELEKHILQLHAVAGNAVTAGRFIVIGVGSTQLVNAAIFALSPEDSSHLPASVVATAPFYPYFKSTTEYYESLKFKWEGEASELKNRLDFGGTSIEFVTSPTNPEGKLAKPVLRGPSSKTILDRAYYWPHYSPIPDASDDDLMIFTLSKLTGHAGTRFGWALIRDEKVYTRMLKFVNVNTINISRDIQLRALKILKVVLKSNGRELFKFGSRTLANRWEKLSKSFSSSNRFSLQKLHPVYCTYFKNVTRPSPAYAWVKCEREEDEDCYAVLARGGIIGNPGSMFGAESRYVRFSLVSSQDDFDLLMQRLDALVAKEGGVAYI